MNLLRTLFFFLVFFFCFFICSAFRFSTFIYQKNHSLTVVFTLILISWTGGVFLAYALGSLQLFSKSMGKKIFYGGVIGIFSYFFIFAIEDHITKKRLFLEFKEQEFSEMRGHCGVYSGRALAHSFYREWSPSVPHLLKDYEMSDRCRIDHFLEASKMTQICRPNEDEVQCRIRYMNIFSERGFWNVSVRRMFLEEIKRVSLQDLGKGIQTASWAEYLLKDQELNAARSTLLHQVGVEELFSDNFIYLKESEEYEDLITTKQVLEEVAKWVPTETEIQPIELQAHFQAAVREASLQMGKISEMEKDLQELRKKVQL